MVIFTTRWLHIFMLNLYVVKQIQILRFLKMMSVKFLSMTVILLGYGKDGFCETFAKRGTLQKSGCEVLREEIFENKKHYFPYKLCHSLRFLSHVYCFKSVP